MQSSKIDRIKDLVEQLNAASESYYAKDQEIMSNYEYDKLYDELVELEKETGVTLANSPTVNVGCLWARRKAGKNCGTGCKAILQFSVGNWTG